jgi:putative hydroxymethylpyrimidine transport system substrate-binding protein
MKRFLLILILLVGLSGTSTALAAETLTLMLDWFPNVDHMPIYVAQQRGFFTEQGVNVAILNPSDTADALKLAAAGKVDLAVSYEPQTLMAAGRGIDVRVVGRLIGHPLTTLMYLKEKGFTKPVDLNGRTIGYTVPGLMDVLMDAFAKLNGITDYQLVNVGFSIAPALSAGRVDAVMGPFKTYETVTMAAEGIDTGFFELEKWGIPDYDELIFICGPKTLETKEKSVLGFARAVAKGIDMIIASPDTALADYFKALPDADRKVETAAFELTRPYYAKDQKCDRLAWQVFADFALKHGLIERKVDVAALLPDLAGAE